MSMRSSDKSKELQITLRQIDWFLGFMQPHWRFSTALSSVIKRLVSHLPVINVSGQKESRFQTNYHLPIANPEEILAVIPN
jgi:hypothetical protein